MVRREESDSRCLPQQAVVLRAEAERKSLQLEEERRGERNRQSWTEKVARGGSGAADVAPI